MIDTKEHLRKIENTKQQVHNSKGKQRLQYLKHLHRLQKELLQYYIVKKASKDL